MESYNTFGAYWGKSNIGYDKFGLNNFFTESGSIELMDGITKYSIFHNNSNIYDYVHSYLSLSYSDPAIANIKTDKRDNSISTLSLNLGNILGYGYKIWDKGKLFLYNGNSTNLTISDVDIKIADREQSKALSTFNKKLKYSTRIESGAHLFINDNLSLDFSYNRQLIYSNYMFFYDIASTLVYDIPKLFASYLSNYIGKSYPELMPVLYFIIENTAAWSFYELKSNNSYWPVKSSKPIKYDFFRIGFSYSFK